MQIGTFRKNVMKTVTPKPTKLGMRLVSRNTIRTNVARSTVALKRDTGRLLQVLSEYVLGAQFTQEMSDSALVVMGDIGYDLTILCRMLKVKMPSATKKSKLSGTRTAALLQLDGLTTQLLTIAEVGVFAGPVMTKTTKEVVIPSTGAKEQREVDVVDTEAENAAETERQSQMKAILSSIVDIYWRLNFEMFHQPPSVALAQKFLRIQQEYPQITFDTGEKAEKSETATATA